MLLNGKKICIITGPTASGKTNYSIELAKKYNGIIINADSMQMYKYLPILSSQPTEIEKGNIEHLLFSYLEPIENNNVGLWLNLVREKIEYCFEKNKLPIIVGGTGMYISKLINGMSRIPEIDPTIREQTIQLYDSIGYEEFYKISLNIDREYVKKLNKNDKQRLIRFMEVYKQTNRSILDFQKQGNILYYPNDMFFTIYINPPREILYDRCLLRLHKMVKDGCLEEIRLFINKFPQIIKNVSKYSISHTLGLIEGVEYLNNKILFNEFIEKVVKITRNYAKRQYTWFNHQLKNIVLEINKIPNANDLI